MIVVSCKSGSFSIVMCIARTLAAKVASRGHPDIRAVLSRCPLCANSGRSLSAHFLDETFACFRHIAEISSIVETSPKKLSMFLSVARWSSSKYVAVPSLTATI
jgi:hypothetical protein